MKRYLVLGLFFTFMIGALVLRGCSAPVTKVYSIARDPSWYPLNLMGKDKNILAFTDDLLVSVAQDQGFNITFLSSGPENLEGDLLREEYDAIMTAMGPSPARNRFFTFSEPYFITGPVLVVPVGSGIEALSDMHDKRVGVKTTAVVIFSEDAYPAIVLQTYATHIQALEALMRDEIDGLIMDLLPAYTLTEGLYRGSLEVVGQPLTSDGLRLVARKGVDDELIKAFNAGLAELKETNGYRALLRKWGLFNPLDGNRASLAQMEGS